MNPEMLEIVLTELLEEQKKETITNVEMVSIVKKVLEKLEIVEQVVQPRAGPGISERLRAIQIACQANLEKPTSQSLQSMPVQTIVKHHFYFKTTAVIAVSFFMIMVILTWLYLGERKESDRYKANDIKYRYLQLNASPSLKKVLSLTDSLYLFTPDSIKRKVAWIEKQQREQSQMGKKQEQPAKQSPKRNDEKELSK
jgi:hypothetical protein